MASLEPGTIVAGKFRLVSLLARGGMGSVWVAHHQQLDVPIAIKFIDAYLASSADARERFEREAKAAAQLRSPHVVSILDHGVDGDTAYIVMELLEGEDLGTRLKRERRLSLQEASSIVTQIARALRRVHEAGIVHRDLKPANVFIARHDEDEIVKVLDFGIAKAQGAAVTSESTKTGVIIGSPQFMSPEQARGLRTMDHRSDLWSLGVILFRVLTGKLPFVGENSADIIVKICADPVPIASEVAPDLPPEVDRFFERALSRHPGGRFQSAREMAAAFAEIAGMSVSATGARRPLTSGGGAAVDPHRTPQPGATLGHTPGPSELSDGTLKHSASTIDTAPRPATRLWMLGALAGIPVVVGAALLVSMWPTKDPPGPAGAMAQAQTTASAPPISAVNTAAPRGTVDVTPSAALAPSGSSAPPRAMRSPAAPPRPARASCDPPFVIGADGTRRLKPECLR